jgi:hypothetical protein
MSYNILHDDDSGNRPQLWNNIKANKMTCTELFLANGLNNQQQINYSQVPFYNGVGPDLVLSNSLTSTSLVTIPAAIKTYFQVLGNTMTLVIEGFTLPAGSTTPAPYDLYSLFPFPTSNLPQSFVCAYSHVIGNQAQDTLTYKLTYEGQAAGFRLRNNGLGITSEYFDNTQAIGFPATTITILL